jgi:hypothetical protein
MVTATVHTRYEVSVPFLHVDADLKLPCGEWVALETIRPPIQFSNPGEQVTLRLDHAKLDPAVHVRLGVKWKLLRAVLEPHADRITIPIGKRTVTLVSPIALCHLLRVRQETRSHFKAGGIGTHLEFRSAADFEALPDVASALRLLVRVQDNRTSRWGRTGAVT